MTLGVRGPIGVLTAGLLLAGCSSGDQSSSSPQADASASASATPGSGTSGSATSEAVLRFDQTDGPGSGRRVRRGPAAAAPGRLHLRTRFGSGPSQPVRLTSVSLADASRVVADGTWIAPTSGLPEAGLVRGWPAPRPLLGSPPRPLGRPSAGVRRRLAARALVHHLRARGRSRRRAVSPARRSHRRLPRLRRREQPHVVGPPALRARLLTRPGSHSLRSTTTGAWSEAPCPARSSRSMNAPVTRGANEGVASTKSIFSPRSRSKRWR